MMLPLLQGARMADICKTLWLIETRLGAELSLAGLAAELRTTPHGLARAFAYATGHPLMRYARARRLSEAARRLLAGASSVAEVAFDHGYGSHEAFTRAFRRQFGLTPDAFRAEGRLSQLSLTEPIRMTEIANTDITPARIVEFPAMRMVGLRCHIAQGRMAAIPAHWQLFNRHIGHIPDEVQGTAYGICLDADAEGGIDYAAAVEVGRTDDMPPDLSRIDIPAGRHAVFHHAGNVATIQNTIGAIFAHWVPRAAVRVAARPVLEVYGPAFDPATGEGGFEIRVPLDA